MASYTQQTWVDGTTPINAERLNHIESGVGGAVDSINDINIFDLGNRITSGDLDDYTTVGRYYCANSSDAGNIENIPRNSAFQLLVIPCGQTSRLVQLVFTNTASPGYIYSRMYNSNGWSGWTTIA